MYATESHQDRSANSFHILCVMSIMLLSACSTVNTNLESPNSPSEPSQSRFGDRLDSDDLDTLISQPYIDPITRFILRNKNNELKARQVEVAYTEQQKRCEEAFNRIMTSNPDRNQIARFSLGYQFSCPLQVSRLQTQADTDNAMQTNAPVNMTDNEASNLTSQDHQQASECYLLLTIKNYTEAKKVCQPMIERGNLLAIEGIAQVAHLEEDYENFMALAAPIAEQSASLSFLMGQMYELGQNVPVSLETAEKWYRQALQLGNPDAQAALNDLERKQSRRQ